MSEKVALILVDIQNDFLEGGSLAVPDSNSILKPVLHLIRQIKQKDGLVIATQDWHPQNHISFASNHDDVNVFDVKQIEYEGQIIKQVMWPDHCVQHSSGAAFSESLDLKTIDCIVQKGMNSYVDSYSGFADNQYNEITTLAKILYQHFVDTVYIVGLATDFCVKFTCLDSIKFGFKTVLVKDCTKPVDAKQWQVTLDQLESKGVLIQASNALF
ncbi:nicotinamidase [Gilbertella persicaria]|uniref:nicotinamidase n=1 Tax=Gilbertella persicaria TaxID=101096 RepID=UPI00221EADCE|nr:nicotinamidase [Gilbertella persicaria]KAI8092361.1 nicotinamidase [Gilbertella persicaria]